MALTSQRKTGNLFSDLDRLVIALGFSRAPEAVAPLLRKLGQLEPDSELSHYKAISLALWDYALPRRGRAAGQSVEPSRVHRSRHRPAHREPNPRRAATEPARAADRLLTTDADDAANHANLNRAMKELTIAALLYRCGDRNGQAEAVLNQYARDLHGHFARYAAQTLTGCAGPRGP